jgi:hypothetical protein
MQIPIGKETYGVFIKRTQTEDLDWTVFGDPFTRDVWQFLLVYSFVCTITIKAIEVAVNKESRYRVSNKAVYTFSNVCIFLICGRIELKPTLPEKRKLLGLS